MRDQRKPTPGTTTISRRNLLRTGLTVAALAGTGVSTRAIATDAETPDPAPGEKPPYVPRPNSPQYTLPIGPTTLNPDGKKNVDGIVAGGSYPGREIRVREGDLVRLQVENHLTDQATTLHWHGLLLPAGMDGVPDVSNAPIPAQQFYVYEYPLRQSGTYWYHSHVGFQEQIGLAGPLIIEAKDEPLQVDHDAVVMLTDWLYESPYKAFEKLRSGESKAKDVGTGPDLADITYDAFLLNGRSNQNPWTFVARPGERIRLRIINAGASTYFRVMLDGHPLEITHADGLAVQPVVVDEVLMGMAECYDAVVRLSESGSYTLRAISQSGSGQAIGVLHTPDVKPAANLDLPKPQGRALSYADLRAVAPTTLPAGDQRRFELALEGNMAKYIWMINGQVYPKADPLVIRRGEQVKIDLVNKTMMWHPMHLHGHYFRVLQGAGELAPLKHTVNVAPKETVRIEFTADNPGRWIFHCHNLYHLDAGMARVFEYVV